MQLNIAGFIITKERYLSWREHPDFPVWAPIQEELVLAANRFLWYFISWRRITRTIRLRVRKRSRRQ